MTAWAGLAWAALAMPLLAMPARAETCRFSGETSRGGTLVLQMEAAERDGELHLHAMAEFAIRVLGSEVRYYGEELSTWRGGALLSVAVNQRTAVDGVAKRQQWDVFTRQGDRLEARRVQGRRADAFAAGFPAFARHWSLAAFGQAWLGDFAAAMPERRPDLDLPAAGAVRTPLAMALYWSRWLPPGGADVRVVLPGFKREVVARLRLGEAVAGPGWQRWSAPLVHAGLEASPPSLAAAWVSPAHYLLQLGLDVHTRWVSGRGVVRAEGCRGVQVRPE